MKWCYLSYPKSSAGSSLAELPTAVISIMLVIFSVNIKVVLKYETGLSL